MEIPTGTMRFPMEMGMNKPFTRKQGGNENISGTGNAADPKNSRLRCRRLPGNPFLRSNYETIKLTKQTW